LFLVREKHLTKSTGKLFCWSTGNRETWCQDDESHRRYGRPFFKIVHHENDRKWKTNTPEFDKHAPLLPSPFNAYVKFLSNNCQMQTQWYLISPDGQPHASLAALARWKGN
jgi:hypothetical protein